MIRESHANRCKGALWNSNLHESNKIVSKYIKHKFVDLQGEIEKWLKIIVWDFNMLNKCQKFNNINKKPITIGCTFILRTFIKWNIYKITCVLSQMLSLSNPKEFIK